MNAIVDYLRGNCVSPIANGQLFTIEMIIDWRNDMDETKGPIVGEQIDSEIAQLFKFYAVESMFDLVKAQARHIEKLQEKLLAVNQMISHERPINSGRHG